VKRLDSSQAQAPGFAGDLLLGVIGDPHCVGGKALEQLGVDPQQVRNKVVEVVVTGMADTGSVPFTPRAKKVLELSMREALKLGHNYVGTEHILLGLIVEGGGHGARVRACRPGSRRSIRAQDGHGAAFWN